MWYEMEGVVVVNSRRCSNLDVRNQAAVKKANAKPGSRFLTWLGRITTSMLIAAMILAMTVVPAWAAPIAWSISAGTSPWAVAVNEAINRAYVANYGSNNVTVITYYLLATVSTTAPSGITSAGASSGGNVTSDGGDPVSLRGVCWSTSPNPTTHDSHTTDGTGTGTFASSITGLTPGTPYHVRAYAINGVGTSYGTEQQFTTDTTPTVTTDPAASINTTGATLNGNITATGGENADQRGFRYRKTGASTWTAWTQAGSFGTGAFSHAVTGLTPGTQYDFQAQGRNSAGTSYGSTRTFTTASEPPAGKTPPGTWQRALPPGATTVT